MNPFALLISTCLSIAEASKEMEGTRWWGMLWALDSREVASRGLLISLHRNVVSLSGALFPECCLVFGMLHYFPGCCIIVLDVSLYLGTLRCVQRYRSVYSYSPRQDLEKEIAKSCILFFVTSGLSRPRVVA